ncbi:hypothetical protein ScPMuIL_000528 [Solemya velum]
MKGFIVVNRMNEVLFIDSDSDFEKHINNQALEQGLLESVEPGAHEGLNHDVVMQLFSPLFMSQWFMVDQARNPCSSITCDNGFRFVFRHTDEMLIVAINGDGTESEDFLSRKISVFLKLTSFLYGPVSEEIGHPKLENKKDRSKFLQGLMRTWEQLVDKEQAFLVEAVERLHVNQSVNEKCLELLENAVYKLQNTGEKLTQHALLLVNSKLMSLYSNRNAQELQPCDILLIIIFTQQLFPSGQKLEDFFANRSSTFLQSTSPKHKSSSLTKLDSSKDETFLTTRDDSDRPEDEHGEEYLSASEVFHTRNKDGTDDGCTDDVGSSDDDTNTKSSTTTDGTITVVGSLMNTNDINMIASGSLTMETVASITSTEDAVENVDATISETSKNENNSVKGSESFDHVAGDRSDPSSFESSLYNFYHNLISV